MKLSEKLIDGEGSTLHVKKTVDPNPTLKNVEAIKQAGVGQTGENRHIGRVPGWLIAEWLKEAGVRWDDIKARDEVIKRKMMSGDYAAFRNWEGSY